MKRFLEATVSLPALRRLLQMNDRLIFQYCMLLRVIFIKYEQPVTFSIHSKYENARALDQEPLDECHASSDGPLFAVSKPDLVISDYPIHQEFSEEEQPYLFYWNGHPSAKEETAQASDQTDQKCQEQDSVRPTGIHPNGVSPL